MPTPVEIGWIITTIGSLSIASYFDIKERIVPDKIWLVQLLLALILDIYWISLGPGLTKILMALANLAFTFIFVLVIAFTGAMGGADVKAIFVLAFSHPIYFTIIIPQIGVQQPVPVILYIITNFMVLYLFLAIAFLFYNLFNKFGRGISWFQTSNGQISQKLRLLFEGVQIDLEKLQSIRRVNIAEKYENNMWSLYTPTWQEQLSDEEFEELEIKDLKEAKLNMKKFGKKYIWVRPQIPGIVFFLLSIVMLHLVGPVMNFLFEMLTSYS